MSEDRTITETELTEAFKRMWFRPDDTGTANYAKKLVDDIVANREPEWQPGDVVRSARGHYYRRSYSGIWQRFGESLSYTHNSPTRPLNFIGNDYDLTRDKEA